MAARVVKCIWKYDPIRVYLFKLHWLRVPQRIEFKVLTKLFKCLNNLAPEYLQISSSIQKHNVVISQDQEDTYGQV